VTWLFSDAARAELAGSHTAVSRVEVWHSGVVAAVLGVQSGQTVADSTRPVRRNLDASLVDPDGTLSRSDASDLLNPFDCEVAPWRGVRTPAGDELAPLGVYRLTSREVQDTSDGLVISLSGQDRAIIYQGPMEAALGIAGGTPIETAIARLLARRHPGLVLQSYSTGFTCGPLVYPPDVDVWAEAQSLAESAGAKLYHDRTGQAVLTPAGPTGSLILPTVYAEGGGRLLAADRTEDADTILNVVVAENPAGTIRVVVEDTDPASPTYARGRYGRHIDKMTNQHFGSTDQAMVAATARLVANLGRSEIVQYVAVPDPAQDVDEPVVVHRPRAGLNWRRAVTSSVTTPLAVTDPMQVSCRKSVLTPDGWADQTGQGALA